jgi:curli biogenesis system outer membrane secretion channel CsgG
MTSNLSQKVRLPVLACLVCTLLGCATPIVSPARPLPANAVRQVVAVSSFENRTSFDGPWRLGDGMADLLISELVASQNFIVVERANLDVVVDEIDRQSDRRFRQEGRVDQGRLKNARYMIRGIINDFSQVGGTSFFVAVRRLFFGGRGFKARVAMTLTIVDIESGEIIDSVQCSGIARARSAYASATYKNVNFGGDAFFKTPLGIATSNTIRRGIRGIVKKMPRVMWRPMIAEVMEGNRIILNGGLRRGFRKDRYYQVRGEGKVITDPATGDVLHVMPGRRLGVLRVIDVSEKLAVAEVFTGSGFARGQLLEQIDRPKESR